MTPIKYYWEDFAAGWKFESHPRVVTAEVIRKPLLKLAK